MATPVLLGTSLSRWFRERLDGERALSDRSVESYKDCFRLFLTYLRDVKGTRPESVPLSAVVDRGAVLDFLSWLESERGCGTSTRNQRLAAIKSFCHFVALDSPEYLGPCSEVASISKKGGPAEEIGFLTADEVRDLLAEPDRATAIGWRDCVLLTVLYDTAARVQEICDVRVRDVRLDGKKSKVTLHGKGSKDRTVPLMEPTADLLGEWMESGRRKGAWGIAPDDEHLFHSSRSEHMTRWCVERLLDGYVASIRERDPGFARGIRVTPHVLRHSKASHLVQSKVNIIYIRDLLGHANAKTTEIYARLDIESKRKAIEDAYEPLSPDAGDLPDWSKDDSLMDWLDGLG